MVLEVDVDVGAVLPRLLDQEGLAVQVEVEPAVAQPGGQSQQHKVDVYVGVMVQITNIDI